ncbi:MAG: trypsin-like peptidase domain-containing protein, partial [Ruminococcus sp.]|nr:trypsin-like peptidase domain-containing protein [Ruminococcus sp.]
MTVVCYKDKITDSDSDIVAQGTGTVISSDGYIVTNAHVISNSRMYAINIVFNNNDEYPAKIVGYDTWTDLAVLKIDAKDLKAVTFGDSALVNVGDDVIAIGSPGGQKFQNSLTRGIVSAVDRELSINKYVRYIQSDAAISPGNSG